MVTEKIRLSIWPEFHKFLATDVKLSQSETSQNAVKSRFNTLVGWFQEHDLSLNRKDFTTFLFELKDRGLKDSYLNKFIALAKHLDKFIGNNEFQDYTYFKEEQNLDIETLTADEVLKLANVWIPYQKYPGFVNQRQKAIILIQSVTGARPGEILNLRKEDFHETPLYWYVTFKGTKTSKQRKAPIGKLGQLISDLPPSTSGYIFESYRGKKLREHDYNEDLKRRAKACGLEKKVWAHLLRHSAITELLDREMEVTNVSTLVGHADPRTTMRYKHTSLNNLYNSQLVHPILANEMNWELQKKRIEQALPKLVADKFSQSIESGEEEILIRIKRNGHK